MPIDSLVHPTFLVPWNWSVEIPTQKSLQALIPIDLPWFGDDSGIEAGGVVISVADHFDLKVKQGSSGD
jgi:hypothetical protein